MDMAKKQKVNKSQAVREYAEAHPEATSGEIAAALGKKGIKITANYAANIKSQSKKKRQAKRVKTPHVVVEIATPVTEERPVKAGDMVTVEQVKKVAELMKTLGGQKRLHEVLEMVKELGGVKKFKELVAAISASETDAIPF
jgi:hypothetical protein